MIRGLAIVSSLWLFTPGCGSDEAADEDAGTAIGTDAETGGGTSDAGDGDGDGDAGDGDGDGDGDGSTVPDGIVVDIDGTTRMFVFEPFAELVGTRIDMHASEVESGMEPVIELGFPAAEGTYSCADSGVAVNFYLPVPDWVAQECEINFDTFGEVGGRLIGSFSATLISNTEPDLVLTAGTFNVVRTGDPGNSVCGDGTIEGGEHCEGTDLAGQDCASLGFTGGALSCDPTTCFYDTTGCS
jgi:hypothetical protein